MSSPTTHQACKPWSSITVSRLHISWAVFLQALYLSTLGYRYMVSFSTHNMVEQSRRPFSISISHSESHSQAGSANKILHVALSQVCAWRAKLVNVPSLHRHHRHLTMLLKPGARWRHQCSALESFPIRRHSNSEFQRGLLRRPPGPAAALASRIPQILSAVSLPPSSSLAASLGRPARWGAHRSPNSHSPNLSLFWRTAGWFQSDAERSQDG